MMKHEYFECQCSDSNHVLRFCYDEEYNEMYTEVQLVSNGFFSRLKNAFRYLFKLETKYGVWDCTMLCNEDMPRLISLLQKVDNNEVSNRSN